MTNRSSHHRDVPTWALDALEHAGVPLTLDVPAMTMEVDGEGAEELRDIVDPDEVA